MQLSQAFEGLYLYTPGLRDLLLYSAVDNGYVALNSLGIPKMLTEGSLITSHAQDNKPRASVCTFLVLLSGAAPHLGLVTKGVDCPCEDMRPHFVKG